MTPYVISDSDGKTSRTIAKDLVNILASLGWIIAGLFVLLYLNVIKI